ncbi:MAG: hypothetical protein JWP42_2419 [Pseudomonas sp.]|nr:hypothetical protein [Pseudomonas sp.]
MNVSNQQIERDLKKAATLLSLLGNDIYKLARVEFERDDDYRVTELLQHWLSIPALTARLNDYADDVKTGRIVRVDQG